MPTNQFMNLKPEKRNLIIDSAVKEFAENGVLNASTNSIVKNCGISKGSLFKYFETKDEMCLDLFEIVTNEMLKDLSENIKDFSSDLFQKIIDYSVWETGWYIKNPLKGKFVIAVAKETDKDFVKKRDERFQKKSENVYEELLSNVSADLFRVKKSAVAKIIKWVIEGYNQEFLSKVDLTKSSINKLQKKYLNGLVSNIDVLKRGVLYE